jgi:hypothetical protein
MTTSSAPALVTAAEIDAALMRFPYEQWIAMPDAARHVAAQGLPDRALTTVVRAGRRRGVLRTRRTPEVHYVKRVHLEAKRPAATAP